jgi:hypothetical protein
MTKRRSKGDGSLFWDDTRQRWLAEVTVGYKPNGRRIVRRGSGRTKTAAQRKLKEIIRDYEDGLVMGGYGYTVADAVGDWLTFSAAVTATRLRSAPSWRTRMSYPPWVHASSATCRRMT